MIDKITQEEFEKKYINTIQCADCLEVMRGWPDKCVDLVLTDPPYGTDFDYYSKGRGCGNSAQKDYGEQKWNKQRPPVEYFREMVRISRHQIIFGLSHFIDYLIPTTSVIVWHKDNGDANWGDCELAWTSHPRSIKYYRWRWNGMLQEDMAHKEIRVHPTQKPLGLILKIVGDYSGDREMVSMGHRSAVRPGHTNENCPPVPIILDPFAGSGTTLVAAKQLGRKYIGIEIEPKYVAICKERLKQEQLPL